MPLLRSYMGLVRHDGNSQLFRAAELSILSSRLGWPLHLHAEGVRGTGKTTILRGVKDILPRIRRIKGCPYNCHPRSPHCPVHRGMTRKQLAPIGTEWITMPFVEISHSAKLGTVVGTIDLARITSSTGPEAVLLPGTLARAHRGIVFVDEINRLADTTPELADVLLDVMGTRPGRLQIEESGLQPVEFPLEASVWAASNPDEEPGPLEDVRRQLSDRFDLTIGVSRPSSRVQVKRILEVSAGDAFGRPGRRRTRARRKDQGARRHPMEKARHVKMALLHRLRQPVPTIGEAERDVLAAMYIRFDLESLRAVEAWQWAARVAAHRAGHARVRRQDLLDVAGLVLAHRLDPRTLAELLTELEEEFLPAGDSMAGAAGDEAIHAAGDGVWPHGRGHRAPKGAAGDDHPGTFPKGPLLGDARRRGSKDGSRPGGAGRPGDDTLSGSGSGTAESGEARKGPPDGQGDGSPDGGFIGRLRRWLSGDQAGGPYGDGREGRGAARGTGSRNRTGDGRPGPQPFSHRPGVVPPPPNKATALASLDGEQVLLRLTADQGPGTSASRPGGAGKIRRPGGGAVTAGRAKSGGLAKPGGQP